MEDPGRRGLLRLPLSIRLVMRVVWILSVLSQVPSMAVASASTLPAQWEEFDRSFSSIAPSAGFLAAEIVDDSCETVHGLNEDDRLAVASTIKLYVLAELAWQISAGKASWDEVYPIQDRLKSLPSGSMAFLPAGTLRPLREYAALMIGESDNTATDHLIARLGRENIEADLALFGHGAPELNRPFLNTRELFTFRIGMSAEQVAEYLSASDVEQRRMLSDVVDPYPLLEVGWGTWTAPRWAGSVEWFASPSEICLVLAKLFELSRQTGLEPLRDILMQNRGGNINSRDWPLAGFKGGYEAGVYNLSWLLTRDDGRIFVLTAGFNDPEYYIDQGSCGILALRAADLLANEV
jgi:hypothetical protein